MISTVRAYYNTGLVIGNSLDSINLLDTLGFTYRDFSNIAIKQDRGQINIRINTQYTNIKDADYVKINNVGYWITSIIMLNDNVAELTLQQDFVTTVGTSNLDILSGWCVRRHVTDDTMYSNIIDEPFTPTNPLKIDFGSELNGSGPNDAFDYVIVSSVDLSNLHANAEKYVYPSDPTVFCAVPLLDAMPVSGGSTKYKSHVSLSLKECNLPATNAYVGNSSSIMDAIAKVRSLGIESCLIAAYTLPNKWADGNASNGKYTDISDHENIITSTLPAIPGSYKNNKVYSGQFQKIISYSLCTGENSENRIEDVVDSLGTLYWYCAADPRYNGSPVCMPYYFHGSLNNKLASAIKGAPWQSIPIAYSGASGMQFINADTLTGLNRNNAQLWGNIMGSLGGMLSGAPNLFDYGTVDRGLPVMRGGERVNTRGGIIGPFNSSGEPIDNVNPLSMAGGLVQNRANLFGSVANHQFTKEALINNINRAVAQVDMQFPRIPSIQDYIGNTFREMRYRLSNNDMVRFDNFLSAYGYAVDELLSSVCFSGRQHFNYVQAKDVILKKSNNPQYLLDGFAKTLEAGVRIWHTAPTHAKLIDNPIVT